MNYGLALAGGGARGAAHIGILKALEEENLLPDTISGTSAGSIVAGLYASGMSVGELCEVADYLSKHGFLFLDPDFMGIIKFIPQILAGKATSLTGLFKGNRLLKLLCELTDSISISDVPIKLVIPAVDLKSGLTIAYTNSDDVKSVENVIWEKNAGLCEIMMASSSVPAVFRPRNISKYCLVDGGVTNNLPVDLLKAAGQKRVIAIDIGVDYETPHENSITEIISHSFSIMSHSLKDCTSQGEILLLKPQLKKGAGLLTFQYMKDCVDDGYSYAKQMMPQIRRVL